MQYRLGVSSIDQIAVALECPVVAKNARRNELLIHGGAVHLSKESLDLEGKTIYGLVVPVSGKVWGAPLANTYVSSISQEHGIIRTDQETFNAINIGDTLGILPVHSCLTANLADQYTSVSGHSIPKMRS